MRANPLRRARLAIRRDVLAILAFVVAATLVAGQIDLMEAMLEFAEQHEDWELDEWLTGGWFALIGTSVYFWRRWLEFRAVVDAHEEANRRARFLAAHDPLTGLANRRRFDERLSVELARSRRQGTNFALFLVDVDHFKTINDLRGHGVGDATLIEVAKRLTKAAREIDLVARLGGDEFAVLQVDLTSPDDATALARRLDRALQATLDLDETSVVASASIGITVADAATDVSPDALVQQADVALYRAKAEGRGTFRFYAAAMDAALLARRQLEAELREAHRQHAFELYFQPQHRSVNRQLIGYEALLRWHHPERGLVPPDEFIQLAEDTGLIVPLTHWVIEQACATATSWPEDIAIAVNISATHLRGDDLVECVADVLARTGLTPGRLELELTESVLVDRAESAASILQRLDQLGVRLALDDFGTGYSSLSNLWRLPFNRIKIDKSFILSMHESEKAEQIVKVVVQLGATLGCEVLAEGVETEDQLSWLADQGCEAVQGYLFGRPMPAGALAVGEPSATKPASPMTPLAQGAD